MKSNALLVVLLAIGIVCPALAQEKQDEKKTPAPAAERKLTEEEQKLLDEAREQFVQAMGLQSLGKYAEAEQEYRAVLAIKERVLGAEHPDTL